MVVKVERLEDSEAHGPLIRVTDPARDLMEWMPDYYPDDLLAADIQRLKDRAALLEKIQEVRATLKTLKSKRKT